MRVEYVRPVNRLAVLTRRHGFDVLIALAAVEAALEVALRNDPGQEPTMASWLAAPALVIVIATLFARRRFPFAAPASLWLLSAGLSFVDGRLLTYTAGAYLAGMAAAFLLGNLRDVVQARLGLALVLGGAAIVTFNDPSGEAANVVSIPVFFGILWLAGFALRARGERAEAAEERAAQAEREREAAARVAVAEERARIARELHDVVAHAVSVMVLQVGAVRHGLPDARSDDKEVLSGVERTGRASLAEMRRLLGAMRREDDELQMAPQPGLDGLGSLAEEVGRAGLPVRVHIDGDPVPLPSGLDLSAYRIVQEGLTNVLKHAQASHADVVVDYGVGELHLEVRDDGDTAGAAQGVGHGLVGVRERVKIYGGEMTAGTASEGGFVLSARLPLAGDAP